MTKQDKIKIFEEKKIRTMWNSDKEKWYFSIVDVIAVLTENPNPRNYWKVLKRKTKAMVMHHRFRPGGLFQIIAENLVKQFTPRQAPIVHTNRLHPSPGT